MPERNTEATNGSTSTPPARNAAAAGKWPVPPAARLMAPLAGQLVPIPGASYGSGTMTATDLYPAIAGIGGVRSSDWSIPAFSERASQAKADAHAIGDAPRQVNLTTPAGWLALFLVVLAVGSIVIRR